MACVSEQHLSIFFQDRFLSFGQRNFVPPPLCYSPKTASTEPNPFCVPDLVEVCCVLRYFVRPFGPKVKPFGWRRLKHWLSCRRLRNVQFCAFRILWRNFALAKSREVRSFHSCLCAAPTSSCDSQAPNLSCWLDLLLHLGCSCRCGLWSARLERQRSNFATRPGSLLFAYR